MTPSNKCKQPLKILMVAPTSFFSDYGGHIRILEESKALQALGHQVIILTYYMGSDLPGLDIRRTAPLPWRTDYEVGSSRHKVAFDLYLSLKALQVGLHERPDVIHGHMHEGALVGGVLAKVLGVPLVFDFQGSLTAEMVDHKFLKQGTFIYKTLHRLERFISRRLPDAILTSSIQAREILQKEFNVDREIIYPLPDCADTNRFAAGNLDGQTAKALTKKLNISEDATIVAYLGLLTDYQGIPYLIQAASLLKDQGEKVHFLVMGYPNVDLYQRQAQARGVGDIMTFTGKIEYRDAPKYLALGDIAVAPKVSLTEGSGKLLNYMALSMPVVAFDTPVHREYLDDAGVYVPVGDVKVLSEKIQQLIHDHKLREEIGQELRKRVLDSYSWQRAGEEIENIYCLLTERS